MPTTTMNDQDKPQTGIQKVIDSKLPLPWLLGSSAMILLAMGGLFAKMDNVTAAVQELSRKSETRDERMNLISNAIAETRSISMGNTASIVRSEKDIETMRRDIEDLRKTQRWLPK